MRLVSLADLKVALEKNDSDNDELLEKIIERVSKRIETYLNRDLLKAARTVYRDAGKRYYYLSAYPIDEAETLTVTHAGVLQTKDTHYFVRADAGLIEFQKAAIPSYTDPKELVIVWMGGYVSSGSGDDECLTIPDDMKEAVLRQCAYNFRRRKDIGLAAVSMPDGSISKFPSDTSLLPEVKDMLKTHRRPPEVY